ncbi:DNA polymerase III subunit delta (plasmid) [Rossellomorea sp. AcN35-11]|nr:DNA polymerase III subunit delta [Rossellomorea aquimaris]WJV32240.1 DNA polymerase III subunit delta [Rossellomorea sp. AcN35-11]
MSNNVHLLHGTEPFLMEERQDTIVGKALGKNGDQVFVFDCKEVPLQEAIQEAQMSSLFGDDEKVVLIKDAYFLTSEKVKSKVEHNLDVLIDYFKNPNPSTTIIILCPYEKLDGRKKLTKLLKKEVEVYEAKPLSPGMVGNWIRRRVKQHNVQIEPRAVDLLGQLVGSNLVGLVNEIHKLALFVGDTGMITENHVRHMVSRSLEQNIFLLINKAVNKRLDEAFEILTDLLKRKEDPIPMVILFAKQFRLIYQVGALLNQGMTEVQIAKELGQHPYPVKLAAEQVGNFDKQDLINILNHLTDLDYKMKTGRVEKKLALEMFLASLKTA